MPDGRDADAGAHVDELVAVDIDEDAAVGALDIDGQQAVGASGHDRHPSLVQCAALRAGKLGDDTGLLGDLGRGSHAPSLPPLARV